jgi:hypothetical protein
MTIDNLSLNEKMFIYECCVCKKIKDVTGTYKKFLPPCPHYGMSSGYCPECIKVCFPEIVIKY